MNNEFQSLFHCPAVEFIPEIIYIGSPFGLKAQQWKIWSQLCQHTLPFTTDPIFWGQLYKKKSWNLVFHFWYKKKFHRLISFVCAKGWIWSSYVSLIHWEGKYSFVLARWVGTILPHLIKFSFCFSLCCTRDRLGILIQKENFTFPISKLQPQDFNNNTAMTLKIYSSLNLYIPFFPRRCLKLWSKYR